MEEDQSVFSSNFPWERSNLRINKEDSAKTDCGEKRGSAEGEEVCGVGKWGGELGSTGEGRIKGVWRGKIGTGGGVMGRLGLRLKEHYI